MRLRISIIVLIAFLSAIFWIAAPRASVVSAAPRAQSTVAPTEEPTKPPYIFPTPVFIPNFPDDTPVPRATPGATRVPGQPGDQTYTIQSGDSPWTIAQKVYGDGTKYPLIMSANNLTSPTGLRVGAVLVIPSLSGSTPPPAPTSALVAPTLAPVTVAPAVSPTAIVPTPQPTPTATSGVSSVTPEILSTGLNILGGILFVGSLLTAILAYVSYDRARRMEQLASGKRPFRVRQ